MNYHLKISEKTAEAIQKLSSSISGQRSWQKVKDKPETIERLKRASVKGVKVRQQKHDKPTTTLE